MWAAIETGPNIHLSGKLEVGDPRTWLLDRLNQSSATPIRVLKKAFSLPLAHARGSVTAAVFLSRDREGAVRSIFRQPAMPRKPDNVDHTDLALVTPDGRRNHEGGGVLFPAGSFRRRRGFLHRLWRWLNHLLNHRLDDRRGE
jgi:hypothetical protein